MSLLPNTEYFNTDQIFMAHQHNEGTRLHFNVPDGEGHKTRDVVESVEVVSALLDVENPDD